MVIKLTKAKSGRDLFIKQTFIDNDSGRVKKILFQKVNKSAFDRLGGPISKVPKSKITKRR